MEVGVVMSEVQAVADVDRGSMKRATAATDLSRSPANEPFIKRNNAVHDRPSRLRYVPVFHLVVLLLVYCGWKYGGQLYITPEQGIGYALGIMGGTMMLLLMLYPLRKHARWAQRLGPVRYWFRGHMLLGVMGPVCILLHCNFSLGSVNGNVALFSMLLVAGSGLVGRFIYSRVHYGLYGRRADLEGLGSETAVARAELGPVFKEMPEMKHRLQRVEEQAAATQNSFLSCLVNMLAVSISSRWCLLLSLLELQRFFSTPTVRNRLTREQRRYYHRKAGYYLRTYLYTVRKVAGFKFFDRLFSMWHILHLPLFLMLLLAGLVHVYAVHMY